IPEAPAMGVQGACRAHRRTVPGGVVEHHVELPVEAHERVGRFLRRGPAHGVAACPEAPRSEEHTSELQSLMRISYAVFCLKKTTTHSYTTYTERNSSTID